MATAEQIKALLESHVEGDDDRFLSTVLQLAEHAARRGHGKLAQELRAMIDKAREAERPGSRPPTPLAQPRGELAGLLGASYPQTRLADMILAPDIREQLDRVVREQRQRDKLAERRLHPRRKLLLVGPPGTGKTYSARALAGELHLPLFTVALDSVIARYTADTAAKLRLVFEAAARTRGVYFFDDLDALGGERANPGDVGEARRTLSSFLQFIEQDESDSLLVAAIHHGAVLDRALFRRYDDLIEFAMPDPERVLQTLQARLAAMAPTSIDWNLIAKAGAGLSYADLVWACDDAAKDAVLNDRTEIATRAVVAALQRRHKPTRQ
ncbi:MAG: ATP-binding protein [Deltaproteobacteria bacterium]|nr:MAG: ATP-binding protein [Deltaproteobacteria bacterium]